ncbi:MAG: extradiol dioxygenase [Rhodospirillales bacterium]|jgi:catechol 2,3-dioxygenase-like lactoylglutathione lyase family enzyme|nr:extradiol dioxygenase [Rhodospirillales bacterium]MBT4006115.1 extradiol dioxygenase [Rhodospirillales bacterium]MBT5076180.1 extradiol dioxygenase [Rhodospirillales bacterium]MBT5112681.1 extradiol dioxygenase [Rhodospirillales bacterium]MBT5673450.1 extradiol dioxygenase [Rhodospirillales bacterium]
MAAQGAAANKDGKFDVGGILMDQPFKIRRLGHFGINTQDQTEMVRFYTDLLGFKITDFADPFKGEANPPEFADLGDCKRYFARYASDHHALALYNHRHRIAGDPEGRRFWPGNTINQLTWQVGSLEEVVNGHRWLESEGCRMVRTGRDMPGSNWHTYLWDPDGHINEIYYGIEQVGWTGKSKPWDMFYREFHDVPDLPQIGEAQEVDDAMEKGIDIMSGYRYDESHLPFEFDVQGILMPRPFKIVKIGPVGLFVKDLAASLDFYVGKMGFIVTEETQCEGERVVFLRSNTEHHSLVLSPIELRAKLGLSDHTTTQTFGVQLANYQQLLDAVAFFEAKGFTLRELPPEMTPGMDYNIFVIDPDGHAIQLFYYMEQVGWDGKPRAQTERRPVKQGDWPETVEPLSDVYMGEPLLGPWN